MENNNNYTLILKIYIFVMNIYDNEYVICNDCVPWEGFLFSFFLLKTPPTYKGNVSGETNSRRVK